MKDYRHWHIKKHQLQQKTQQLYFYEREVWWVAIGLNVGDEEDGKGRNFARPVLVLRKFNKSLFYGVPLSTKLKEGKYYSGITLAGEEVSALMSQMRSYDSSRLLSKLGSVSVNDISRVRSGLSKIIGL